GQAVATNGHLGRLASMSLGSYWDASTGWYDDVRVYTRPPSAATPFSEAEDAFDQRSVEGVPVRVSTKPGASGLVVNYWDVAGQSLDWALSAPRAGEANLLLKYATASPDAERQVQIGAYKATHRFPGTGAYDSWRYAAIQVPVFAGVNVLTLTNVKSALNLDWLALVPSGVDAQAYGSLVDQWVRLRPWRRAAEAQTAATARSLGITPPDTAATGGDLDLWAGAAELEKLVRGAGETLADTRERVLSLERPHLQDTLWVCPHRALGPQTELSRECYRRLMRYVRMTDPQMRDWPYLEGCRYHKVDGHLEHSVRQNATVAFCYATLLTGNYDPTVAGVSRERIAADLFAILRYLSVTHRANFLPTGDGSPWGDDWQSAHWACYLGHAAWLVWDSLDDDLKTMVARVIVHEADRYNTRPPDSGEWSDTKAEENAWNSQVIALAACMFPRHPRNELWQERAKVYMINSYVRASDRTLERLVDGRPAKDRLSAVTLHADFTLENHGRVHPDYLACFGLMLRNALLYWGAGLPVPESTLFNVPESYAVMKRLSATNGSFFYVNGQDWWPHRHDTVLCGPAFLGILTGDPDGAFLERADLDFLERMHARFTDGRLWNRREFNYPNAEEEMMARYAELVLLHRMAGDGPKPSTREEFLAHQSGVQIYETGGFVTHRTPQKLASFTWVNGAMGLVFASDDTWLTAPSERGMVGRLQCEGLPDSTPKVERHQVSRTADGFALTAEIARCGGRVGQSVAVISLGSGPVVYLERLVARDDVTVTEVATGTVPILNEDAPGINPNQRTVSLEGSQVTVVGCSNQPAQLLRWTSPWACIDNRLGVLSSSGSLGYRDDNAYRRSRLEEELIANYRSEVGTVKAKDEIGRFAMAILPNCSTDETRALPLELAPTRGDLLAARLGKTILAANLGTEPCTGTVFGRTVSLSAGEAVVLTP
ncbi:hypothetical protein LLH03_14975, partial [bacterium]|nr:hypothetical protein [bacterium]